MGVYYLSVVEMCTFLFFLLVNYNAVVQSVLRNFIFLIFVLFQTT